MVSIAYQCMLKKPLAVDTSKDAKSAASASARRGPDKTKDKRQGQSDGSRSERDRARAYGEGEDEAEPEPLSIESDSALEDMRLVQTYVSFMLMVTIMTMMRYFQDINDAQQVVPWDPAVGAQLKQWDPKGYDPNWNKWDWSGWQDRQIRLWEDERSKARALDRQMAWEEAAESGESQSTSETVIWWGGKKDHLFHLEVHYNDGTIVVDGKKLQYWQLESYREGAIQGPEGDQSCRSMAAFDMLHVVTAASNDDLSREERGQILSSVNAMAATLKEVVKRK
eukprot:s5420_g1.t1